MLTLKKVSKTYQVKDGPSVNALTDISLDLPSAGLLFILGHSGSGKTTLLNLIGGLDRFTSGDIFFYGKRLSSFSDQEYDDYRNQSVGFVFQDYNLLDELSVEENIQLSLELQGRKCQEACDQALKSVGLDGYQKRRVSELSGGQKQRVAIARAIVKNPSLILADEPTGALYSKTGHEIMELLKSISKERLVIMVSHDEGLANEYGERIIHLSDGRVISDSGSSNVEQPIHPNSVLTKKRLSFKKRIALTWSFLKVKPVRIVLSLLTMVVSLSLFGLSFSFSSYSYEDALARSLSSENTCLSLSAEKQGLSKEDLSLITEKTGISLRPSLSLSFSFESLFSSQQKQELLNATDYQKTCYATTASQVSYLTQDDLHWNGLLIEGQIPEYDNEVAISDYSFQTLQHYGILSKEGVFKQDITAEDVIGREVNGYTITGIINTGFKPERYASSFQKAEQTKTDQTDAVSNDPLYQDLSTSLMNSVFVSKSLFEEQTLRREYVTHSDQIRSGQSVFFIKPGYDSLSNVIHFHDQDDSVPSVYVSCLRNLPDKTMAFSFDEEDLPSPEFISYYKNYSTLPAQFIQDIKDIYQESFYEKEALSFEQDLPEEFHAIKQSMDYSDPISDDDRIRIFIQYYRNLTSSLSEGTLSRLNGKALSYYQEHQRMLLEGYQKYLSRYQDVLYPEHILNYQQNQESRTVRISGVFFDMENTLSENTISANDAFIHTLQNPKTISYSSACLFHGCDYHSAKSLICLTESTDSDYVLNSRTAALLKKSDESLTTISRLFLYIGMIMLIFTILLLVNDISTSVEEKKDEIGILRAMGARNTDIFDIIFFEGLSLSLFSSLLSFFVLLIVVSSVNGVLSSAIGTSAVIVSVGWLEILLILLLGVVFSFLSSLLPMRRIRKTPPVEYIRSAL